MPIKENISVDDVLEILNRALVEDPEAMSELFLRTKVPCSEALAEDESIQVGGTVSQSTVGPLGVLNGLFGVDDATGYGILCARVDKETQQIQAFERTDFTNVAKL